MAPICSAAGLWRPGCSHISPESHPAQPIGSVEATCDSNERQIAAVEADRSIPCFLPWLQLEERTLGGRFKVCCWTPEIVGICSKNSDESLIEIWRSSGVQAMQQSMLDGTFHEFCPDSCPVLSWRREPCKDTFYRYDPAQEASANRC
jgi:hypothetical protein